MLYEKLDKEQILKVEKEIKDVVKSMIKNGATSYDLYKLRCETAEKLFGKRILHG